MIGIYKITSPVNRVYIGQSRNIHKRYIQHKSMSNSVKSQRALYQSFFQYGFDNHYFEVIHEFKFDVTQEVLDEYEDLYIRQYKYIGFDLFNVKSGGINGKFTESFKRILSERFPNDRKEQYSKDRSGIKNWFFGKTHTGKTRKIMSEKKKISQLGNNNTKARAIIQYDLHMNQIAEFSTINEAAEKMHVSRQSINCCCGGWNKTAHGFIWKYKYPKANVA